jgi:hypothetical protein
MVEALQRTGIDFRPGTPFQNPWGPESGEPSSFLVGITTEVDKPHKRAIAKILMNFVAFHLGDDEVLAPRWDFLRRYIRYGEAEIKARLSHSINVRIENLDGNVVGAIQFYNLHTYEMILIENDALHPNQEIGRRYIPGQLLVLGEKRPV